MVILPFEMIESIFQFFDTKTLLQMCYVSHLFYLISKERLQWIKLCFNDSQCQPLIQAAMLEKDLLDQTINAETLYHSIIEKNVTKIIDLLFVHQVREFALCAPFYEKIVPQFFPRAVTHSRKLFLTEEAAKGGTINATRVRHWPRVKISVEKGDFAKLYHSEELESEESILAMPIVAFKQK